jgi:hypothetical protein
MVMAVKPPHRTRSASGESWREILGGLSRPDLELLEAVSPAHVRQRLRQVLFRAAATGRPEVDDDDRLLAMEIARRNQPGLSVQTAAKVVVSNYPVRGTNPGGEKQVWLGSRCISEDSARKSLKTKFHRRREAVERRANGVQYGQQVALRWVTPLLKQGGGAVLSLSTGSQLRKASAIRLADAAMPDAVDALLHVIRSLVSKARSG